MHSSTFIIKTETYKNQNRMDQDRLNILLHMITENKVLCIVDCRELVNEFAMVKAHKQLL